jgi:hypothetical protein
MSENELNAEIKELEAELSLKNKEISEYVDRIEYLEDMIMELEEALTKESDKYVPSVLKIHIKDLEKRNRDLKNKLSISKLETVKLKQKLENFEKAQLGDFSLIQAVGDSFSITEEVKIKEEETTQKEQFEYMEIRCPECEIKNQIKIPIKIINQIHHIITLSIPKGLVCNHKFQVFFDKSLTVKRYQVADFDFPHVEFYESAVAEDPKSDTQFAPSPFLRDLIFLLRDCIDDRDILGAAVFTKKGKVIYASVPSDLLFNITKEFKAREEKQLQKIAKMFIELKNQLKMYSEYIEVQNTDFILVLIFSKNVNFGMGSMLLGNIKSKIAQVHNNNGEI